MKAFKGRMRDIRTRWYVWLFPIFAALISAFLVQQHFYNRGLLIKVSFDEASVIQRERTRLRYRGVDVGTVVGVQISADRKNAIVSIRLVKGTDDFAVEGSKFWIVTPKVSLQGLSGLETLFSGPYIELSPGPAHSPRKLTFKGREPEADVLQAPVESVSTYILEMPNAESINPGDAITYRGINVGNIGKLNLNKTSQMIDVQINIQNKYTRLVRTNTVFWRKIGIQAKMGLFGANIKVNSVDSIMHGGVEFATPNEAGPMARAGTKFTIAPEAPKKSDTWNPILVYPSSATSVTLNPTLFPKQLF